MINIRDIVGEDKEVILSKFGYSIEATNNVNNTIELRDVTIGLFNCVGHALVYFDLVQKSRMLMIIVKIPNVSKQTIKILKGHGFNEVNNYMSSLSFNGRNAFVTYLHKETYERL